MSRRLHRRRVGSRVTTVRDVVKTAGGVLGWLPAGDDPSADDGVAALNGWNRLKRGMFGTVIGPRLSPIGVTGTAAQAESGGEYQIPGGAAFTLTAPGSPRNGARFGAVDTSLDWDTYPLTIARNGRLLVGAAANVTVSSPGANVRYWFRGDTASWIAEADSSSLDSVIEFPGPLVAYLGCMLAVVIADDFSSKVLASTASIAVAGAEAFARVYGRRGAASLDKPIGVPSATPQQGG
jgi:hypothetical protein